MRIWLSIRFDSFCVFSIEMQKKYLEEYKKLRRQVREHVKDSSWSEQIVQRRLAINYFDANKIDHVVLKESKRGLLTIDPM